MDDTQAKAVLGICLALFPVPEVPPSTQRAWAALLLDADHESCLAAAKELGRSGTPRGVPFHISMVLERAEVLWREQYRLQQHEVTEQDAEIMLHTDDAERARILRRYWDNVGHERRAHAELVDAVGRHDPDARIDAARDRAAQLIEQGPASPAERAERPSRHNDPPAVLRTACGAPAGTYGVPGPGGVLVCPQCRSPISEGCLPRRPEGDGDGPGPDARAGD